MESEKSIALIAMALQFTVAWALTVWNLEVGPCVSAISTLFMLSLRWLVIERSFELNSLVNLFSSIM